ncbi:hypothetical protein I4U23_019917 [Adineta vaga]|nr:hypothetical protein I4U23_019917 [Adineta vaga]
MSDPVEQIHIIKYTLLQITIVPSLICDLFVFAYIIRRWRKEILSSTQNHFIQCLLLVSFIQKTTDLPMSLYLLRWGVVLLKNNSFCLFWGWIDYSLLTVSLHLVMWCSIERHLFVFHSQLMKKQTYLILFHYIPMIICLLYSMLFYLFVIILPTMCENVWDYTLLFCGGGCFAYIPFWGTFDWLFHYATPIIILLLSNVLLVYRFIWQKIRRRQQVQWRRQRRMILQLTFISLLYIFLMSPEIILGIIQALWQSTFAIDIQINYFYFIANFINQFLPFIIISSLPGIHCEFQQYILPLKRYFGYTQQIHPFLQTGT